MDIVLDRDLDLQDLWNTPDDGNRYEILDGAIVMTPPPGTAHQHVVAKLLVLLDAATRALPLTVLPAPVAWRIGPGQVPEPDLLVAAAGSITAHAVVAPPVLVVEVLSPTGRGRDLYEKRRIYAAGRAPWFWLVDPEVPSLLVLRLADDRYEEVGHVTGSEPYRTEDPFPLSIAPADLIPDF